MAAKTEIKPAAAAEIPFAACLHMIEGKGRPPLEFLTALVTWGREVMRQKKELFAPNETAADAYTVIKSSLGTPMGNDASGTKLFHWDSYAHRVAALLELMRVCAGQEGKWAWDKAAMDYFAEMARKSWPERVISLTGEKVFPHLSRDSMREFMGLLK